MYCINCGVELADSETKCPLCLTPVYHPNLPENPEKPYPRFEKPEPVNPRGIYFIISFVCLIAAVISTICDTNLNLGITWSGYVIGGIILAYTIIVLPGWFKRYNPAIFVPVSFAVAAAYLYYISYAVNGTWFLTFALPITGMAALVLSALTILSYYLKRGYLYIWGGAFILTGAFCPVIEYLTIITFDNYNYMRWSIYPLAALVLIGIMLIVIAIVKPLRESLCRIFAI